MNTAAQTRTFSREIEGKTFEIGLGKLAPNALSACTVRYGDTVVLVTLSDGEPRPGIDFFPLTVDFEERMYAIGKIPGSFFRREGRPGTEATLAARMTDRPIRPLFPKGYKREVHVVITLLASDRQNPADALATTGASIVINKSPLPFEGPVSSVRVARVEGRLIAFPTYAEMAESDLELTVAATDDSIIMIEAGAKQIPEADLIEAIEFAEGICKTLNDLQREIIREVGEEKQVFVAPEEDTTLRDRVDAALRGEEKMMRDAVQGEGFRGIDEVARFAIARMEEDGGDPEFDRRAVTAMAEGVIKAHVRQRILDEGLRADERQPDDIRELDAQVGVLPRVHGSGLFQRGQTQVLTVATLGTLRDRAKIDAISPAEWKMFMHHYNFPPFSVGEARPMRAPGRREIGHGMLAEKALEAVLPPFDEFPYTLRLVSDVLSSNGSTSQAAVCGSTLALMDAGVPIQAPVAGIAMGLVTSDEMATQWSLLTDIAGIEDALGDMDFKVAGSEQGITAVQLDIKLKRLPENFLTEVFAKARDARLRILDVMLKAIHDPREEVGTYAPKITIVHIDPSKIGAVIGPGGKVINAIIAQTGASIDIEEDGTVFIGGQDAAGVEAAVRQVQGLTKEIQVGEVFEGPVSRIMSFGAFVEILPNKDGMVHISELSDERVDRVEDVVNVGDMVKVKVIEIDNLGRINLSIREAEAEGPVGIREGDDGNDDRPQVRRGGGGSGGRGGDRGPRGGDRGDRGPRNGGGGGFRGGDRGDRGSDRGDRGDRGPRGGGGGDRPSRPEGGGGDRPPRPEGGGRRW
ncbi:MAG: polyribonucleotide nucleotidyltransferase [Dehalococcoidia bacterium]|nr:polyribonucleotide nucleotidyltransferase [Dehalococcoidia bacterium]